MSNLAQRILTAAVAIPVLVAAMFLDPTMWGVLALVVVAATVGVDEYLRMALPATAEQGEWLLRACCGAAAAGLVASVAWLGPGRALGPALVVSALGIALAVLLHRRELAQAGRHFAAGLSSLLYVPLLLGVLPLIKQELGGAWLFLTLAIAFLSDTGGYAFGRLFGRRKLYPEVSPGKTWAGALGGLFGGSAAALGFGTAWLVPELSVGHALVLGSLGSAVGQVGDLVESMLKRAYGVKDSGRVLPGHGGLLDRIDALLFVAPLVYYYATSAVRG